MEITGPTAQEQCGAVNYTWRAQFKHELQALLNRYRMEQYSDTQDFLLADYLMTCLHALERTLHERKRRSGAPSEPSP